MNPELQDRHSDKCLCTNNRPDGRRRRLVVAFDGTQNQFGPESSHVVEFYSRIAKSGDQLSYYTSGVGTFVKPSSSTRYARMWVKNKWAAAVALFVHLPSNFKSNLLSGYRFLSDKYEAGDQIFLLGFSRGAYQARVLAAMITKVGLLRTGNNEQIPFAFKIYKDPEASKEIEIDSGRPERKRGKTTTAKEFKKAFCHDVNIHFVGVWDTVSSVGLLRNKYYPGAELAENICFFRHALALDEQRVKFLPEYIVAKREDFLAGEFGRPRCKEVWFRGSHSDVGGGSVNNKTSDNGAIPSRWMAYEAMLAGLEMTPFWGGFKVEDLEPNAGKDSMSCLYKLFEYVYLLIKWEDHSNNRPPLLTNEGEPPLRHFSRAWHRKRPRQIFDHQKLHSSVCLDKKEENPPAFLPDPWIDRLGGQHGWTEVIQLLRREVGKAADASNSGTAVLPPLEFPSMPSTNRFPSNASLKPPSDAPSKSPSNASSRPPSSATLRPPSIGSSQSPSIWSSPGPSRFPSNASLQLPSDASSKSPSNASLRPPSSTTLRPPSIVSSQPPSTASLQPPSNASLYPPSIVSLQPQSIGFEPLPSIGALQPQSPVSSQRNAMRDATKAASKSPRRRSRPVGLELKSISVAPVSRLETESGNSQAEFTLPDEAIELDLLDCDGIPTLIVGVLRGTNVTEFLERLEVLAFTESGRMTLQKNNGRQFSSMLQQVCNDSKDANNTGLAIRVAYEVFWHSGEDFDLYVSDKQLWEAIFSRVEEWIELKMDPTTSSSLHRAGRLLHKTQSRKVLYKLTTTCTEPQLEDAFTKIGNVIAKMFGRWKPSTLVPLRFLLAAAAECRAREDILCLAVFSSPHFSDPEFTKILLNHLAHIINSSDSRMRELAMLCFCVLCATDKEVTLTEGLFSSLGKKFEERGTPMDGLWGLVRPGTSNMLHGFSGKRDTMIELRERLSQRQFTSALKTDHLSWAGNALKQALKPPGQLAPPIPQEWLRSSKATQKRQRTSQL